VQSSQPVTCFHKWSISANNLQKLKLFFRAWLARKNENSFTNTTISYPCFKEASRLSFMSIHGANHVANLSRDIPWFVTWQEREWRDSHALTWRGCHSFIFTEKYTKVN